MPESHFSDETAQPLSRLGIWRFWPLRFVVFFVVLIAAYIGCQLLVVVLPGKLAFVPPDASRVAFLLLAVAVVITLYRLLVRWMEKRGAKELGAHGLVRGLISGAAIGIVLFCGVIAADMALGGAKLTAIGPTSDILSALAMAVLAGVAEEIIFRGAVYRLLEDGFGTLVAILLSGALFGLIHGLNPGATAASTAAIAIEAGILLAAAYVFTRSLWLPIGLHIGWNFTEGGIFGAAVSGGKTHGLITTIFSGPDWLTGGKFGPEASLPAVVLCLSAALILIAFAVRRGEWKPLRFRLATA